MLLKKFRSSLRLDKRKSSATLEVEPEQAYCSNCGQRTPNRSTFGAISSRSYSADRSSWNGSAASDSGYGSALSSSSSQASSPPAPARDAHAVDFMPPPSRRTTYSSSVYSNEENPFDTLDHIPMTVEECDEEMFDLPAVAVAEYHEDHFGLPPRTLSSYSSDWTAKSRYARLNELPAASPRALMFPDDVFDFGAGIEVEDGKDESKRKRGRWHMRRNLSVNTLPSQLRRLSLGKSNKD